MSKSRMVAGIFSLVVGLGLIVWGIFVYHLLIYGIPLFGIGVYMLIVDDEDKIEEIKYKRK